MKKTKLLAKVMLLAAPVMFSASIMMAQTDASSKKSGNKMAEAQQRKGAELQNKKSIGGIAPVSTAKIKAAQGSRPCVTTVRKNPFEVTQAMLKKMPLDRQAFVKAHPEKYTITSN